MYALAQEIAYNCRLIGLMGFLALFVYCLCGILILSPDSQQEDAIACIKKHATYSEKDKKNARALMEKVRVRLSEEFPDVSFEYGVWLGEKEGLKDHRLSVVICVPTSHKTKFEDRIAQLYPDSTIPIRIHHSVGEYE